MNRPIVICGLGRMGARVLEYLQTTGMPVVVIDTLCKPDDHRLAGTRLVSGDCRQIEVLAEAGVANARGVLVLTTDDLVNVTTALLVRTLNSEVPIVLRMFNQNLLARLGKTVRNVFALSTSSLTAPMLALTAVTGQGLGYFRIDGLEKGQRQVVDVTIDSHSELCGLSVAAVASARDAVALAHERPGQFSRYLLEVDPSASLEEGDHLVLCGEPRALAPLLEAGEGGGGADLRWANWLLRLGRALGRTLSEIDLPVKVCTSVLLLVLCLSTLVLNLAVERYQLHHAFLRTVSIMATGAGLHEDDYKDSPRVMVFVSVLRIVGAALMATFTAIITNYLIRARLGGAFEVRRIPDGGHVIVCGLSTIGFRVVEELINLGERVVVIERDQNKHFVGTARRLGAVVISGDACVAEVLRQARAATARAVIATINNDMTNLEVALLVREQNESQRIILLLNDPQFAKMLREATDIRLALSVPALAAPAFVAGLFGDWVASAFLMGEGVYAVVDLYIHDNDPFVGHAVRAMAYDYRLLPVAVLRPDGSQPTPLLAVRLGAGDRLVAIIALGDLERLFKRQPSSAAYAVEVIGFPLPTRSWLIGLARTTSQLSPEEADRALEQLPFRLAENLTRGQAEDLLAQLDREKVKARVCLDGERETVSA